MKQYLTERQGIYILCLFVFSGNIVIGTATIIKQEFWIAILLSLVLSIPMALILARLMVLYPESSLNEILIASLGKIAGKIFIGGMVFFALTLAVIHLTLYSYFVQIVALSETPNFMVLALLIFACGGMARTDVPTIGKWTSLMFPLVLAVIVLTLVLSGSLYNPENILPIGEFKATKYLQNALIFFSNNIGDIVLLLFLGKYIKKGQSPYKLATKGVLLATLMLVAIFLRNILVLGIEVMQTRFFPSYTSASLIQVGEVLNRIEGTITMNFIIALLVKISICAAIASSGLASIFEMKDPKKMIIPVCLLLFSWSLVEFRNVIELVNFMRIYYYFALPFQVLVPMGVWITAEIRRVAAKKQMS